MLGSGSQYLTWRKVFIAPFEAGAVILHKVSAVNFLRTKELVNLIGTQDAIDEKKIIGSRWIDFPRYASLLNVHPELLRQGFLDQSGFETHANFEQIFAFPKRYCPVCLSHRYRCVFFDLACLHECPWHRVKLEFHDTDDLYRNQLLVAEDYSSENVPFDFTFSKFEINFSAQEVATILGYCLDLAQWRLKVRSSSERFSKLINRLDLEVSNRPTSPYAGGPPLRQPFRWVLGFLRSIEKEPLFCNIGSEELPAKVVYISDEQRTLFSESDSSGDPFIDSVDGAIYRSVKHQIYKKYVRPHKKCLIALLRMSQEEACCIDGGCVCPIALAFVAWRMSVEQVVNIEGLAASRRPRHRLKLMAPDGCSSMQFRHQWTYLGFGGLYSTFCELLGRTKITVELMHDIPCRGHPLEKVEKKISQSQSDYYVLHPIIDSLALRKECNVTRRSNDVYRIDTARRFSFWAYPDHSRMFSNDRGIALQIQWPSTEIFQSNQRYYNVQI